MVIQVVRTSASILPRSPNKGSLQLGLAGSASAAFHDAATEVHYGEILLWESEASGELPLELADPVRGNGVWVYDGALGVPVYVNQNPWSAFDPGGLAEKDLAVNDAMEDEKLEYKEASRLKWDEGQAEKLLEKSNPGKLDTVGATRQTPPTESPVSTSCVHLPGVFQPCG